LKIEKEGKMKKEKSRPKAAFFFFRTAFFLRSRDGGLTMAA
jgi:hypothetical protein